MRNQSLDALRGFAILAMVLSGSIAFGGVLPAWMYHAQVPPPKHVFDPTIPGITWVDLVFPFFLFSMGAALPLALNKLKNNKDEYRSVLWIAARRFVLLTFFAIFIYHMRAWVISPDPSTSSYLLSILAFVLLCFQFYNYKGEKYTKLFLALKSIAFIVALYLLYALPFNSGAGFKLEKSDIIIIVLGNMSFFGAIIWWLTRKNYLLRWGILVFVMAVFLGAKEKGTWNEAVFNWSPVPWMYKFYYLKYLFIIVPGTFAGEWMLKHTPKNILPEVSPKAQWLTLSLLSTVLIITNVVLLFSRLMILNLAISAVLCSAIFLLVRKTNSHRELLMRFWQAGTYLLFAGLFFEAYEGGIKKDPSTYSYYFVTSGLAFFGLIAFYSLRGRIGGAINRYLALNGQNPMVAYVAGNLLLTPVLHLTGAITLFESMNSNAWLGLLKGILFTGIVSLITIIFTKRKWFWKT